jgi:hypothetical protein
MSSSSSALHRPTVRPVSTLLDASGGNNGGDGSRQMNVCIDCKDMILQIIKAQRATRRKQFTQSLLLR